MIIVTIAQLTLKETQRRRILWVALFTGAGFLAVFAFGFNDIYRDMLASGLESSQVEMFVSLLLTAGLYVINFLIVMTSVLTSAAAISSEVDTHTIEALITKPIRRWELILGKWLGFSILLTLYVITMTGGTMLIVYLLSGFVANNVLSGMGLMVLEGIVLLSLTIAGGTRLSTLANGVLAFMLYGIAFIGGWVEQIGSLLRNETAVDIGIITSLILPSEILWKKALTMFQPELIDSPFAAGPFAIASQPSDLMIVYALVYGTCLMLLGLWSFSRRDL